MKFNSLIGKKEQIVRIVNKLQKVEAADSRNNRFERLDDRRETILECSPSKDFYLKYRYYNIEDYAIFRQLVVRVSLLCSFHGIEVEKDNGSVNAFTRVSLFIHSRDFRFSVANDSIERIRIRPTNIIERRTFLKIQEESWRRYFAYPVPRRVES